MLMQSIRTRRSIRRYRPDPIPDALLQSLVETAIWAPSAHNRQPWRFCIVRDRSTMISLAQAMNKRLRVDLIADGAPDAVIEADVTRSYARITGAAALVTLCLSMADMDTYPDPKRAGNEHLMAVQSTAMAGQNLLLAAHESGLGACWMCAPLFCPDVVSSLLDLPPDWEPHALITLGWPAETREKTRHPVETHILWR